MLSAIVNAFAQGVRRDLYLVPVSIHYGRIVEEEAYRREVAGEAKQRESLGALLRGAQRPVDSATAPRTSASREPISLARGARTRTARRFQVESGEPAVEEEKRRFIQRLGFRILREVNDVGGGGRDAR